MVKSGNTTSTGKKGDDLTSGPCETVQTVFKTLLLIIILPPMLNYAGLRKEQEYFQESAILFDIGFGQKMFMNCSGKGAPTIILDAPTGGTSDVWLKLQNSLADVSTVCIYDRAGLGLSGVAPSLNASDPGEGPVLRTLGPQSTVMRMVTDLHRLVTFSSPKQRPLVLVGSELGAVVARTYSHLHPQDVGALVLIDPIDESLFHPEAASTVNEKQDNPWINYWFHHVLLSFRLLQLSAMLGLNRLGLLAGQLTLPNISDSEEVIARQKHQICDPFHIQAAIDEHSFMNESLRQVSEITGQWSLPANISVTAISGSYFDAELHPSLNRGWNRAVQNLIHRIPGIKHVLISEGDRYSIYNNPEEISMVIKRVVKRLKESGRKTA